MIADDQWWSMTINDDQWSMIINDIQRCSMVINGDDYQMIINLNHYCDQKLYWVFVGFFSMMGGKLTSQTVQPVDQPMFQQLDCRC